MDKGLEEMRVATPLSKVGMGKLKRLWVAGEFCRPATVPELVMAGRGGLLPVVPPVLPLLLLLLLLPLLATAKEGGRRAELNVLLPQCGMRPGRLGGVSSRPCSSSLRTLHVAAVSETTERNSESFPWSFFCLVRRFWNQTFTWWETKQRKRAFREWCCTFPVGYWKKKILLKATIL